MSDRLDEIQARVEAATLGSWERDQLYGEGFVFGGPGDDAAKICEAFCSADADFIAHAREDVPYLLAEVKRLTTERDDALLDVARMRDTQKDMGSVDDAVKAILLRYPDDPYAGYLTDRLKDALESAEVKRLRDVVEAARIVLEQGNVLIERYGWDGSVEEAVVDGLAILDTGLEGDTDD